MSGAVMGGGLEIAAACHVRVAEPGTLFRMPEGQRGIFVGGGGAVRIARLVSVARMTDMMLTGRTLSAAEAERLNLVQYLVDDANVLDEARRIAVRIADNAPMSNYAITNALSRTQDMSHDDGLFFEALMAAVTQNSGDARERLKDFLEKRTARIGLKRAHD
jgi:enoyl-CoA hydratase/carnithine racemase